MDKGLSLVIPAHNSEEVIGNSLKEYYNAFSKKFKKFEIIVVCNDCVDHTPEICYEFAKKCPIKTIKIIPRGKGYALIRGFREAKYDLMGFLDSDNPFNLDNIIEMIDYLENYDAVIVSKYKKGQKKKQEFLSRRLISLGGSFFSKVILGLPYRDTQAGAKFFRKETWKKIDNKKKSFICTGFDWDMEFLYKLKKNNLKVAEVYMQTNPEKFSTFRLKYLPGMVKRLLILKFLR